MYKVLLIEDDNEIAELIKVYFNRRDEMRIETAYDGTRGEEMLYESDYDLVLLDIMMPGLSGYAVCDDIRSGSDIPIIFLTAKNQKQDVLHGYSLGCDDYIVKPFSIETLYAKCKALLKRSKGLVNKEYLECGNVKIDPVSMEVYVSGERIDVPRKETEILLMLMENKSRTVSREEILLKVWGYDFDGNERIVDNRIKNLRKLLKDEGRRIKTVFTKGYRMTGDLES